MFKEKIRDVYLIGISFIAGVLFIVQCGGQAASVAQNVAEGLASALNVQYTNAQSRLNSNTVQAAVDELAAHFPLVYDKNNKIIGTLIDEVGFGWEVWYPQLQTFLSIDPITGSVISCENCGNRGLVYREANCGGTPYLTILDGESLSRLLTRNIGNKFYAPNYRGQYLRDTAQGRNLILSYQGTDGVCVNGNSFIIKNTTIDREQTFYTYVEAKEVQVPQFEGPLYLGNL